MGLRRHTLTTGGDPETDGAVTGLWGRARTVGHAGAGYGGHARQVVHPSMTRSRCTSVRPHVVTVLYRAPVTPAVQHVPALCRSTGGTVLRLRSQGPEGDGHGHLRSTGPDSGRSLDIYLKTGLK